jgi:hypothetical protein
MSFVLSNQECWVFGKHAIKLEDIKVVCSGRAVDGKNVVYSWGKEGMTENRDHVDNEQQICAISDHIVAFKKRDLQIQ